MDEDAERTSINLSRYSLQLLELFDAQLFILFTSLLFFALREAAPRALARTPWERLQTSITTRRRRGRSLDSAP